METFKRILDAQYNITPLGRTPGNGGRPCFWTDCCGHVAFQAKGGEGLTLIDVTNSSNPGTDHHILC